MGEWKCVGPEGCCASQGLAGEAGFALVGSLSLAVQHQDKRTWALSVTQLQHVFSSQHGAALAVGGCLVTAGCNAIPYLFDLMVQRRVCYELVIKFL